MIDALLQRVLSRVMRKYNSVTYEVGKAKSEQASGMFGLTADQRSDSCPFKGALFKKFCKRDFCDEVRDFKIPEPEAVAS